MNVPDILKDDPVLSILGASNWLKSHDVRPYSRHALYVKIARGEIPARELTPRVWVVRVADLEKFAAAHRRRRVKQSA